MTSFLILAVVVLAFAVFFAAMALSNSRRKARESFIDGYAFPPGIRDKVHKKYPHLTPSQLDLVFDALRDYFHLHRTSGRQMLAMPSQVVDVAWHEFIVFTRHYQTFCERTIGRFLHHTPAEAMRSPTVATEGIKRTWRAACKRDDIDPRKAPRLPLLFAIDARLEIPDGFRYQLDCSRANTFRGIDGDAPIIYCGSHIGCGGSSSSGDSSNDAGDGGDGGGGDGGGGGD